MVILPWCCVISQPVMAQLMITKRDNCDTGIHRLQSHKVFSHSFFPIMYSYNTPCVGSIYKLSLKTKWMLGCVAWVILS